MSMSNSCFQVEWGWNYLLSIRNNQLHIASSMQADPSKKSAKPRTTKNRPRLPDTSHHSPQERPNQSHHADTPHVDPGSHSSPVSGDASAMKFKGSSGSHGNARSSTHGRQTSREEMEDYDDKKGTISMDASPTAKAGTPGKARASDDETESFDKLTRYSEGEKTHSFEEKSSEIFNVGQYGDDYGAGGSYDNPQSYHTVSDDQKAEGACGKTTTPSFQDEQAALQAGAFAELSQRTFDVGQDFDMQLKLKVCLFFSFSGTCDLMTVPRRGHAPSVVPLSISLTKI